MLAEPVAERGELPPGLADQVQCVGAGYRGAGGPVPAGGKRPVPQQIQPRVIGRNAAWPRLHLITADRQTVPLKAGNDSGQGGAGSFGVDRLTVPFHLVWRVAVKSAAGQNAISGQLGIEARSRHLLHEL